METEFLKFTVQIRDADTLVEEYTYTDFQETVDKFDDTCMTIEEDYNVIVLGETTDGSTEMIYSYNA